MRLKNRYPGLLHYFERSSGRTNHICLVVDSPHHFQCSALVDASQMKNCLSAWLLWRMSLETICLALAVVKTAFSTMYARIDGLQDRLLITAARIPLQAIEEMDVASEHAATPEKRPAAPPAATHRGEGAMPAQAPRHTFPP